MWEYLFQIYSATLNSLMVLGMKGLWKSLSLMELLKAPTV